MTSRVDFDKVIDPSAVKGKTVVITGGANGIGAGFAEALAKSGAFVTIGDEDDQAGTALCKRLQENNFQIQFLRTDVASFPSLVALFKAAISFSPSSTLDIVFPCAGISGDKVTDYLANAPSDSKEPLPPSTAVLDVTLTHVYNATYLALYYFKQTSRSSSPSTSKQLIFISSIAGYVAMPLYVAYNASKFGVRGIFQALRDKSAVVLGEGLPRVRTNLIAPTFVRTNFTKEVEQTLTRSGKRLAEVSDCVDGLMRIVCDEGINGRAIGIFPRRADGTSGNIDFDDDSQGLMKPVLAIEKSRTKL